MKNKLLPILLLIPIIGLILYLALKTKAQQNQLSTSNPLESTLTKNLSSPPKKYQQVKADMKEAFETIIDKFGLSVNSDMLLTTLVKESGFDYFSKKAKDIIGDGGFSLGYMQISPYAVKDVNKAYASNYTDNDRNDNYLNLVIGSLFLNVCFLSAIKLMAKDPIFLAYKKYNGGNDETETSKNDMASIYANDCIKIYNQFKEL